MADHLIGLRATPPSTQPPVLDSPRRFGGRARVPVAGPLCGTRNVKSESRPHHNNTGRTYCSSEGCWYSSDGNRGDVDFAGVPVRLPSRGHQDRGESKRGRSLSGDRQQRCRHPNCALPAHARSFLWSARPRSVPRNLYLLPTCCRGTSRPSRPQLARMARH